MFVLDFGRISVGNYGGDQRGIHGWEKTMKQARMEKYIQDANSHSVNTTIPLSQTYTLLFFVSILTTKESKILLRVFVEDLLRIVPARNNFVCAAIFLRSRKP
jgi:hypothetical protein